MGFVLTPEKLSHNLVVLKPFYKMWTPDLLIKLRQYEVILGSNSAARKKILTQNLGLYSFRVVTSTFKENLPKDGLKASEYVSETAKHKIDSIRATLAYDVDYLLVVADTIVCCGGEIFEKPATKQEQLEMLKKYRKLGYVEVLTSVHVCKIRSGTLIDRRESLVSTSLEFNTELEDTALKYYADSGEGLHVAGGFKYQETGSILFTNILGDYFNVVGLPAQKTFSLIMDIISID